MAKYTMTVYDLKMRGFNFGLTDYPIFDEEYRTVLNNLILDNYMTYEIGFETPLMFRHYLNTKMRTIMPKYNELFKAQMQMLTDGVFNNTNLTEQLRRNVENNGKSKSTSDGKNKNLFQDTPQGQLSSTDIDDQKWATNLTLNKNEIEDNTETEGKTLEDYTKTIVGNNGKKTNIEQYVMFINNFQNINQKIIDDLNELFMGVL